MVLGLPRPTVFPPLYSTPLLEVLDGIEAGLSRSLSYVTGASQFAYVRNLAPLSRSQPPYQFYTVQRFTRRHSLAFELFLLVDRVCGFVAAFVARFLPGVSGSSLQRSSYGELPKVMVWCAATYGQGDISSHGGL